MSPFKSNFKTILLLIIFNYAYNVNAQEIEWQNTIGGSGMDYLYSIKQTGSLGGYILGGYSTSDISGDKTENNFQSGSNNYWIVKVNSLGTIQWQNTIGGLGPDNLHSICETNLGGYILGGWSASSMYGDKTENSLGGYDYWIIKISSSGTIVWQNTIGGDLHDRLTSVQQTSDGGFILGGYSQSNISGDKTESCLGFDDYWIVKTDFLGNIQWQNTIGGAQNDQLCSVQQTSDGGYILGGTSWSDISVDKTENSMGSSDYWIVKVNSLGTIQWQNTIGGGSNEYLCSIQQTSDGGYILGGSSSSYISGDKTEDSYWNDYWIVKTDSLGNIQWQNTIKGRNSSGTSSDILNSLEQTSDGGYILGGYSQSGISEDKTEDCLGDDDYWVVKLDSIGNIQWQNTIGGSGKDQLYSIQQTSDGSYILGGYSQSNISGDKTENCIGLDDYWIVKLTGNYNLISGKVYADFNSNGIQDSIEPSIPGKKITEQGTGRFSFSQLNGEYTVSVLNSGNYTVATPSLLSYSPSPTTHAVTFTGSNQTDSLNDFAYQPSGIYDDLSISITPLSAFRSGFNATYQINYTNIGTTTISPTVYFYQDSNLNFLSASLTPSQITPDSVYWNLPALTPFQSGSIIITVNVDLGLTNGTLINSSSKIEPLFTDADVSNNTSDWPIFTTGSFDPNDIIVDKTVLTIGQLSTAPWLDYLIRFQNTGNDTAFTVKILNPIDTNKLNISTIEFVNSSHPVNLNWINYQRNMEFKFDNILLPDSNVNEPLSHGFVHYRIKPKTNLVVGDTIKNFAAIYFDFNEPVITNTVNTVIVTPTGLPSLSSSGKLLVYPNPAQSKININGINLENGKAQLRLFDMCGKIILEKIITSANPYIDIHNLLSGMYLLQSGNQRATFVKQ